MVVVLTFVSGEVCNGGGCMAASSARTSMPGDSTQRLRAARCAVRPMATVGVRARQAQARRSSIQTLPLTLEHARGVAGQKARQDHCDVAEEPDGHLRRRRVPNRRARARAGTVNHAHRLGAQAGREVPGLRGSLRTRRRAQAAHVHDERALAGAGWSTGGTTLTTKEAAGGPGTAWTVAAAAGVSYEDNNR